MIRNKISIGLVAIILLTSCQLSENDWEGPPHYNWKNPEKYFLPDILLEVSGITWHQGNPDTLYAQQDESGRIFILPTGEKKYSDFRFGKDGDYEDLAELGNFFFVLRSDGLIYSFPFHSMQKKEQETVIEWEGLLPKGEYEGLYGKDNNELYVLCKSCKSDEKHKGVSVYVLEWQEDSLLLPKSNFQIMDLDIEAKLGESMKAGRFQPSALAQHPITRDWYILSSTNKLLVVTNNKWQILSAWTLAPSLFRQPEGLAFDYNGNMYISNEGDEFKGGNVLKFSFIKPGVTP